MSEQTAIIATIIGAVVGPILVTIVKDYLHRSKRGKPVIPSPKPVKRARTWQGLVLGVFFGAITGFAFGLVLARVKPPKPICELPQGVSLVGGSVVNVPANQYWYDTGIQVKKGDWLKFAASGKWWNGISATGPDGDRGWLFGLGRPVCAGCPTTDGYLGELIGKVSDGPPFRIGSSTCHYINQDGNLMLTMNENTGPCKDGRSGSCYDDNEGTLEVEVGVYR